MATLRSPFRNSVTETFFYNSSLSSTKKNRHRGINVQSVLTCKASLAHTTSTAQTTKFRPRSSLAQEELRLISHHSSAVENEDNELAPLDPDFVRMGQLRKLRAYGIEFKEGPKGVGIYSSVDIPFITLPRVLLEVPVELMLGVSVNPPWMFHPEVLPWEHPLFHVINDTHPQTDWDLRQACILLYASLQEDNFWYLYSDFLPPPEDCPSLLLASQKDLLELQDPYLEQYMTAQQKRVRRFWKQHFGGDAVEGVGRRAHRQVASVCPDVARFEWAVAQVWSRCLPFHTVIGALRADNRLMVPYMDMMNHSHGATCYLRWHKAHQRMQVLLREGQSIQTGQELTLDYVPQQPNDALMRTYGFSITDNEWDGVALSSDHKIHRDSFLSTFNIMGTFDDYRFDTDDISPGNFFQSKGLFAAARCLPMWKEGDLPPLPSQERQAAERLQEECQILLDEYPTTLKEDETIIAKSDEQKSVQWNAALKYRMDKKRMILTTQQALKFYADSYY